MSKFNELLNELSGLNKTQTAGDWAENLPESIWENHFKDNFKEMEVGLDVDKHRWYEVSTTVIEIYGELLGIRHITNMFSESQDWEDCCVTIKFIEMKGVQAVRYEEA